MNEKNLKPWRKGQSGNPAGRPRVGLAIAEQARTEIARRDLVGKLGAIAAGKSSQQVKAIELLLAYAYGRPKAEVALEHSGATQGPTNAAAVLRERLDALADRLLLNTQRPEGGPTAQTHALAVVAPRQPGSRAGAREA
jgi:hypothetical protein